MILLPEPAVDPRVISSFGMGGCKVVPPEVSVPDEMDYFMVFTWNEIDEIWKPVLEVEVDECEECEACGDSCEGDLEVSTPMYETFEEAEEKMMELAEEAEEDEVFTLFKIVKMTL